MIALCFPCHKLADACSFTQDALRELKTKPYNKDQVSERFLVEGEKLIVNLGGNRYVNSPKILTVNDFELLVIRKEIGGNVNFDLSLFDKTNNLVGIVDQNRWTSDSRLTWYQEYKSKCLKISNDTRKIFFEIHIKNGEIFLRANLYFNGQPIIINDDGLWIEGQNIFSTMKGCTIEENTGQAVKYQMINSLL